jgi:hypothetical protein
MSQEVARRARRIDELFGFSPGFANPNAIAAFRSPRGAGADRSRPEADLDRDPGVAAAGVSGDCPVGIGTTKAVILVLAGDLEEPKGPVPIAA